MSLLCFNTTGAPITMLVTGVVIPLSPSPANRGPAVNVTSEMRPNLTVDPARGKTGGLTGANFVTISGQAGLAFEWTQDVEYLTTGLTVNGGTAGVPSAHASTHKSIGGDPLVVQTITTQHSEEHKLATAGTAYHAAYTAGAPISDAVGPWTMPFPRRTVQVVLAGGGANPVVVTVAGTAPDGTVVSDAISCAGVGTYEGTKAFDTITSVSSNVDPLANTTLNTGKGFGTVVPFVALQALGVSGVLEAAASNHAASGTVVPTTSPDGTKSFAVRYTATHVHTLI